MSYRTKAFWWSGQGIFGSGLRTGPQNSTTVPSHLSFDTTVAMSFWETKWWSNVKLSLDIINIFDNHYAVRWQTDSMDRTTPPVENFLFM